VNLVRNSKLTKNPIRTIIDYNKKDPEQNDITILQGSKIYPCSKNSRDQMASKTRRSWTWFWISRLASSRSSFTVIASSIKEMSILNRTSMLRNMKIMNKRCAIAAAKVGKTKD